MNDVIDPAALDPRLNAFRPDLADVSLQTFVKASRYVEPKLKQCVRGVLPLLTAPSARAQAVSAVRYGEFLDVFEERRDGFAWVQSRGDRAVGYIEYRDNLNESIAALANRVSVARTFVYEKPDPRSAPLDTLTLGSPVSLAGEDGDFYPIASGGYLFKKHVAPADEVHCADYVFTAGQMLGVPYLTGGRTPMGFDAEGFVQFCLELAGIDMPRFFDQQKALFGHPMPCHWRDVVWKRGDLVFFAGPAHVGIMTGYDHMIAADPTAMQVTVEPLEAIVRRGHTIVAAGRP